MNKVVSVGIAVLLTGCQTQHHDVIPFNTEEDSAHAWAFAYVETVKQRMTTTEQYEGKLCSLKIHQPKGATYVTHIQVVKGSDPELCKAAIAALQSASDDHVLPVVPDERIGENYTLDFKP